ncbi:alpha/beta hydrolase family protein [Flavobacterium piscisymbiosum]|uniref:Prolyl oligopeptidase family serine peptidase n=1 Tax=Flavobacterium piscisymbiosum TaxID=2893753 RepID=A0ABS8MDV7_9FLAO|nr:prolyl oligopeptidase family serine peptidase [Flavobacterium sp. F-30]MCC9063634.1 prolyl oligopeptidase family serine peptidase [Flavobacterium sp. F-30]
MTKAVFTNKCKPSCFSSVPILEFLFLFFILPLVTCPSWGQVVQKKDLTPADYKLWGEVHLDGISPDEKWASYKLTHENGNDTLFVQNIKTGSRHSFVDAEKTIFTRDKFFLYMISSDLNILNLESSNVETISGVEQYQYNEDTDVLLIHLGSGTEKGTLLIKSLKSGYLTKIKDVSYFAVNLKGGMLACSTITDNKSSVAIINLRNPQVIKWIFKNSVEQFTGLTWQKEGFAVAFLGNALEQKINALYYFTMSDSKLHQLIPAKQPDFPEGGTIVYDVFSPLVISDDLKKVFFSIKNDTGNSENLTKTTVEIWNANDKWIYPQNKYLGNFQNRPKLALWKPSSNNVKIITTNELPEVMLNGDMNYAVLSNPINYDPHSEKILSRDFYVLNLDTFEKKIFLKNQPFEPWALNPSPGGKYFAYVKNDNWWLYNFQTDIHTNISEKAGTNFVGKDQELVPESVYGSPGWSLEDKDILIYDQYDIWAATPDGTSCRRLTKGRELGIKYRIASRPNKFGNDYLFDGPVAGNFDLNQDLFMCGSGQDGQTGYFRWNKKSGENAISYGNYYADEIKYSKTKKMILFREQNFDRSPELFNSSTVADKKSFFKSNPQHKNYFWGRSELIEFQNSKSKKLKSVLFYPANYDPKIKYPMIVNIYERQSQELHVYNNPSFENGGGFNSTLMTAQGYFVLLPDIALEYQNPGLSAADCVVTSVKEIIKKDIVNPNKIGLMGHSFGGFESSFIITQTKLFAAAIASGGITDLFSFYNSIGRSGTPEKWRFHGEQWNMGKSPFEIPSLYEANSPIVNASKITTPVLLWTGKNDRQVDPHQSYEFYLALRQLEKKSIMLIYPDQGHVITDPISQKDITIRTLEWFNYYLKDNHSYPWITSGTK